MRNHPRLRGEHYNKFNNIRKEKGSPPPTRGTQFEFKLHFVRAGITPAYAGNTNAARRVPHGAKDHPRLRGEHGLRLVPASILSGSPPPTRGTHKRGFPCLASIGITPAYAGNTIPFRQAPRKRWDHPRLRGEHSPCQV